MLFQVDALNSNNLEPAGTSSEANLQVRNHATSQSPQAYFSNRFDIVYQGDIDMMRYSPDDRLHESSSAEKEQFKIGTSAAAAAAPLGGVKSITKFYNMYSSS